MKNFAEINESNYAYQDNPFSELKDKTLVFFDTETTGLNPGADRPWWSAGGQITELAAKSLDGENFNVINSFHLHAKLTGYTLKTQKYQDDFVGPMSRQHFPIRKILKMTNYWNSKPTVSETELIEQFSEWLSTQKNVVLVAHNAKFDLKMINTRANINNVKPVTQFNQVLDTMQMSREYFIPASQELENVDPGIKNILDKLTTKFARSGKRARISSRLGDLIDALGETLTNWHEAMADVDATIKIFKKFKTFFDMHHGSKINKSADFKRRYSRANKTRFNEKHQVR